MRKDMAKVLVERPRLIDSTEHRGRKLPDELLPKSLGVRRAVREAGGYKQLNENLAPLRRYLERQVGRPWNKVFSDIAANLKSTSTCATTSRTSCSCTLTRMRGYGRAASGAGFSRSTWIPATAF